jgi:hypothetical protein
MAKKNKPKEPELIDDGRTIADMSNVPGGLGSSPTPKMPKQEGSTFKDKWKTYWSTVKMMLVPMFITIGILIVAFLLIYFLL